METSDFLVLQMSTSVFPEIILAIPMRDVAILRVRTCVLVTVDMTVMERVVTVRNHFSFTYDMSQ